MIPKEQVLEFQSRISIMIETNTELMINAVLDSGSTEDKDALRFLERVKLGEEMLRIAKEYMK